MNHNHLVGADAGEFKRAIQNSSSNQYAEVNYNHISVLSTQGGNYVNQYGIEVHDSEVIGDSILIYINGSCGSNGRGIRADRSIIQNNYVRIEDHSDCWDISMAIESYGSENSRSAIENNHIEATRESRGIWASNADIEGNHLSNWSNNNNDEWAIGPVSYTHLTLPTKA